MRFLNARGWTAAAMLGAVFVALALRAAPAAPMTAPTLDHPWSYAP